MAALPIIELVLRVLQLLINIIILGMGAHMYLFWNIYEGDCVEDMPGFLGLTAYAGIHGLLASSLYFSPWLGFKRGSRWVNVGTDVLWLMDYASTIMDTPRSPEVDFCRDCPKSGFRKAWDGKGKLCKGFNLRELFALLGVMLASVLILLTLRAVGFVADWKAGKVKTD